MSADIKKTEWWGAGVVVCLEQGADLHMAQLMPLPLTVSCFGKIQTGFTFLVPAHLGSPRKRAVKRVCVCVLCLLMHRVHTGRAPSYLHNCVIASADITSRPRLRSTSSRRYERQSTHLKFGERSFSCAGPTAWNRLPSSH